jgi:glutamate dehydrogenase (NAD(P)+)
MSANMKGTLAGKKIIVQGLGNVGYHAARFLSEEDDARIIAVIERDGVVINEDGLDIEALYYYLIDNGGVEGFAGGEYSAEGARALEMECDILIPAALEGVIHADNADNIKAKLIAEAANGPVTFEADRILHKKGVTILPDAYVNAGGVIVSYFEWIRNLQHIRFGRIERRFDEKKGRHIVQALESLGGTVPDYLKDELIRGADEFDLVRSGLDDSMRLALQEIIETRNTNEKVNDYRTAAYVISLSKLARSYMDLGVY